MAEQRLTSQEKEQLSEIPIIWIIGPPGSGKFTQSKKIVSEYGCTIINTRNLHSESILLKTDKGKLLTDPKFDAMSAEKKEELFWDEIVHCIKAVLHFRDMSSNKSEFSFIIVDGYPRSLESAVRFKEEITSPSLILQFNAPDEVCRERIKKREDNHGQVKYGYDSKQFEARLAEYHEKTESICKDDIFKNVCFEVDASKSREEIHRDIVLELGKSGIKKRRPVLDDLNEKHHKEVLLGAGLSAGVLLGASACAIIAASFWDVFPPEIEKFVTPFAAVTGLLGFALIGASIIYYIKED